MKFLTYIPVFLMLLFTAPAFAQTAEQCHGDPRTVTSVKDFFASTSTPLVIVQGAKDLQVMDDVTIALGYPPSNFLKMGIATIAFEDPSQGKWTPEDHTIAVAFDANGCHMGKANLRITELKLIMQAIIKSHGNPT